MTYRRDELLALFETVALAGGDKWTLTLLAVALQCEDEFEAWLQKQKRKQENLAYFILESEEQK